MNSIADIDIGFPFKAARCSEKSRNSFPLDYEKKYEYSDILNSDTTTSIDIEGSKFKSKGYPYVILRVSQKPNKYEIS